VSNAVKLHRRKEYYYLSRNANTVIDLDLTVKRRIPTRRSVLLSTTFGARAATVMARTRIVALSRYPSI
jgi:hypothetical protein